MYMIIIILISIIIHIKSWTKYFTILTHWLSYFLKPHFSRNSILILFVIATIWDKKSFINQHKYQNNS